MHSNFSETLFVAFCIALGRHPMHFDSEELRRFLFAYRLRNIFIVVVHFQEKKRNLREKKKKKGNYRN